jgi:2-aminoadipate transaminase
MPEGTTWNQPEGGYFLWLDLPSGVVADNLLARAGEEDVVFIKGADFFFHGGGEESARLAFSFATPHEIDEGMIRLGRLVHEAAAVAA